MVTEVRNWHSDFAEVVHRDVGVSVTVDGIVVEVLEVDDRIILLVERQRFMPLRHFKVRVPDNVAEAMPLLPLLIHPCPIPLKPVVVGDNEVHVPIVIAKPDLVRLEEWKDFLRCGVKVVAENQKLLSTVDEKRKKINEARERRIRHHDVRLVEEAQTFGAVETPVALQFLDCDFLVVHLAVAVGVAVVDLIDGLLARLLREQIDVLALVACGDDSLQAEDFKTPREVLEEVAAARIVAVAYDGHAPELVAVVPHLVLDVGELCVVLVVLLALRAVDCRVQSSFHSWRYYSKF